ncbi:MAG: hypothetical protein H7A37_02830 [Chlamydiales bacterium]|nr:hypothetical protein [Chlamydiia bacterium]MCP5507220.1 hypothetical protein [Chlamydiales bacterium]
MAKTNFTKVEEILAAGLQKMKVERLCELADIAAGIGQKGSAPKLSHDQKKLILSLKTDFLRLRKKDSKIFSKLNLKQEQILNQLEHPESLDQESWQQLEKIKGRTGKLVKELYPNLEDDKLIEEERDRHINKRFNINEKWLPLH